MELHSATPAQLQKLRQPSHARRDLQRYSEWRVADGRRARSVINIGMATSLGDEGPIVPVIQSADERVVEFGAVGPGLSWNHSGA